MKIERGIYTLKPNKIGTLQRRDARWHVVGIEGARLVQQTSEKMILEVAFKYFPNTKKMRLGRICYFYIKYADAPLPFKDSKYRLDWKKLYLGQDLFVDGSKVEIYAALC